MPVHAIELEDEEHDQLDELVRSYSYDVDEGFPDLLSDEVTSVSCSDDGSEIPADASAEAEDMELYDLYDNSAYASPFSPGTLLLNDDDGQDTLDLPGMDELSLEADSGALLRETCLLEPKRAGGFSPVAPKKVHIPLVLVEEGNADSDRGLAECIHDTSESPPLAHTLALNPL
ncbi:hypothetical protein MKEN_00954900 [Mycena kentingensis (nom. inval.)]|nr:hypothetical protein MKEN_00954900 [Mycena kentingensis (nom. inval.)]